MRMPFRMHKDIHVHMYRHTMRICVLGCVWPHVCVYVCVCVCVCMHARATSYWMDICAGNVLVMCAFFFTLFGILGVQLFSGEAGLRWM
jgi:hypothetical protein